MPPSKHLKVSRAAWWRREQPRHALRLTSCPCIPKAPLVKTITSNFCACRCSSLSVELAAQARVVVGGCWCWALIRDGKASWTAARRRVTLDSHLHLALALRLSGSRASRSSCFTSPYAQCDPTLKSSRSLQMCCDAFLRSTTPQMLDPQTRIVKLEDVVVISRRWRANGRTSQAVRCGHLSALTIIG